MSKLLIICGLTAASLFAQAYKAAPTGAPPDQLSAGIRDALQSSGVKITDTHKYTFCEIWLRSTPVADSTSLADALQKGSIPPGALVGAIRYYAPGADVGGQGFGIGVYTLRQGGGDAVLLVRAADDPQIEPPAFEELQALSKKVSGTATPAALRLTKGADGNSPRLEMTGDGEWIVHMKADDTPVDLLVLGVAKG